jgi:hypothetical protein
MSVAQAEAIAKTVPGLKHVVLWRGLIDLGRDIPDSNLDLLAARNRVLVRKELHPALQYLLLEAMREVHSAPGPFNRLAEFPAEQPNDLPLSAHLEILTSVRSLLSGGDVGAPDAKPEFAYLWRIARAKPSADALTGCFSD